MKNVLCFFCVSTLLLCGCTTHSLRELSTPRLTGLQRRAVNSRHIGKQFDATYDDVWWATISTLQLHDFVLRDADKDAGYIYGVWQNGFEQETKRSIFGLNKEEELKEIEVSVTLEDLGSEGAMVRISSRGTSVGESMDDASFCSRFFASLNKELLLQMQ